MKIAHRLLVAALILLLCLPAAACFTKDTRYLEKPLLTLADMEMLFKSEGFRLAKAGDDQLWQLFMPEPKTAAAYLVEGDPNHILMIYVFESAEQGEHAAEGYSVFTDTMTMMNHKILGAKNTLVILVAGVETCEHFKKMEAAMERARTA